MNVHSAWLNRVRKVFAVASVVALVGGSFAYVDSAYALSCGAGTLIGSRCVVFLTTSGSGTFSVPSDWNNADNTIEVIGAGGAGDGGSNGNRGGGGGAYAKVNNVSLTGSISYVVGAGGVGGSGNGGNGSSTYFNGTGCSTASVCGAGGQGATGSGSGSAGAGGTTASSVGTTLFAGGNGGNGNSNTDTGGGGGGAGAPGGAGRAGGNGDSGNGGQDGGGGGGGAGGTSSSVGSAGSTSGGNGGNGQSGTGGGTGGAASAGTNGTNGGGGGGGGSSGSSSGGFNGGAGGIGTEWDATHGASGGGGGAGNTNSSGTRVGGAGGTYGGGGGGGLTGGTGGKGIVVISYAPVVVVPPGQASNPTPASGSLDTLTSLTLSWVGDGTATSYDVYFGTDPAVGPSTYQTTQPSTSFNVSDLTQGTTYYWRIDSANSAGTTTGAVWSFTTRSLPSQASAPSPTDSAIDVAISPTLSWSGSGADTYAVYFGTNPSPDESNYQGSQATTTYSASNLSYSTTYYWRIDSVNAAGTTTGAVWSFTTAAQQPPAQASAPNPASDSIDAPLALDLTWTGDVGALHDVYFGTDPALASSSLVATQSGTSYNVSNLANSTTYYWRIDSGNAAGTTTGAVWNFTTVAPSAPAAASNPSPADTASGIATSTSLTWTGDTAADQYDVYFGTSASLSGSDYQVSQTATSFDVANLAANTTYYWRIDAGNEVGTTTGAVWSFTTTANPMPDLSFCDAIRVMSNGTLCAIRPSSIDSRTLDAYVATSTPDPSGFGYHVFGVPNTWSSATSTWIHLGGATTHPYDPNTGSFEYAVWLNELMGQGYAPLELAYNNRLAVNAQLCGGFVNKNIDNCAGLVREENQTGADVSTRIDTDLYNSLDYRLQTLVGYLEGTHSIELPGTIDAANIDWSQLKISGHSMGGNQAYYIAKYRPTAFSCIIASGFDVSDNVNPTGYNIADWFTYSTSTNATPVSQIGAIVATEDANYIQFDYGLQLIGLTYGQEIVLLTQPTFVDEYNNPVNGHAGTILDPSLAAERAQACFR